MASSVTSSAPTCSVNENTNIEQGAGGDSTANDVISKLPTTKARWENETLCLYQGFWLNPNVPRFDVRAVMDVQQHFRPRPSDILLTSLPKAGTTWLKSIVFAIMNRTTYNINNTSTHPLLTTNVHDCVPNLDSLIPKSPLRPDIDSIPSPRLLATHIPYSLLPESVRADDSGGCRIVHICRDPKDVFVSMFNFLPNFISKELPPLSFEESFDLFCKGFVPFGPFWDHVLEYHRASLEHPDRVLLLKYEEMQTNAIVQVTRVAEFLGQPFSLEEERNGVVQGIVRLCSFEKQQNLEVNKHGTNSHGLRNNIFYRKGKVGDSKNHLTTEMIERIDQITREKYGDLL